MKFIKNGIFSIVLFSLVMLIGCSNDSSESNGDVEEEETTLEIALNAAPPTLEPSINAATATRDTTRLMFETLVTTDSDFQSKPMLAESIDTSDDNKVFTFNLRQGITFHNGEEMIAEDVIASMERWLENSKVSGDLFDDATWKEEDDYTVVLELAKPSSLTLDTIATSKQAPGIMPKEIIDAASIDGVEEYIGTGPYKFSEWKQDQYIHFTKFDDYQPVDAEPDGLSGKKEALIDNIYFNIVPDASTRLSGLKSNEYDFAYSIPYDNYEQLESDPNLKATLIPDSNALLKFNSIEGISSDVKMREIVNTGLDIDKIMLAAFPNKDFYWLDSGYMYIGIENWASEAGSEYHNQNDLEKAKEMLEETDYDGEEFRIMTTRDYGHFYDMAVVIDQQLKEIGLNSKLEIFDWPTVNEKVNDPGAWDGLVLSMSMVSTPPQLLYLSPEWAGGTNDENIPEMMQAVEEASDLKESQELWDELQLYVWEDNLPLVQFGGFNSILGMNENIKGIETPLGPVFWNATIE